MVQEQEEKLAEYYTNLYNDSDVREKQQMKMLLELRIKNIEHLRNFWFNLIVLSSAVIVGVFPVLIKDPSYFENSSLAIFGLLLLVFMDIIGCFYLNVLLTRENRNLAELNNFHTKKFDEDKKLINKIIEEKKEFGEGSDIYLKFLKDTSEEENNLITKQEIKGASKWFDKNFSDILTTLLILGVLFIILSFVPTQSRRQINSNNSHFYFINTQPKFFHK